MCLIKPVIVIFFFHQPVESIVCSLFGVRQIVYSGFIKALLVETLAYRDSLGVVGPKLQSKFRGH